MLPIAARLVQQASLRLQAQQLHQLGGTTAIPAAKLGADVLGVDIARNLVAAGHRRAAQAGLSAACRFLEGDACDRGGIENKSFDRVISMAFSPPPPEGFISPMAWGSPPNVIERFGAAGIAWEGITCERDSYVFDFKGSPAEFVDTFRQYYGPTMNAFAAAERDGRTDALRGQLVELFERQNQSHHPDTTLITATYLLVTVQVG